MKEYSHYVYADYSEMEKRELEMLELTRKISKSLEDILQALISKHNHPAGTG